jgi:hypothetical protein
VAPEGATFSSTCRFDSLLCVLAAPHLGEAEAAQSHTQAGQGSLADREDPERGGRANRQRAVADQDISSRSACLQARELE